MSNKYAILHYDAAAEDARKSHIATSPATPLTFPTIAEQVISAWQAHPRTISLTTIAKRFGGERDNSAEVFAQRITYTFDDDTSLVIEGRGKAHRYWAELP